MITPDVSWESSVRREGGAEFAGLESVSELPKGLTGLNVRLAGITILDVKRGFFDVRKDADIYPMFLVLTPAATDPIVILPLGVFNDIMPGQMLPLAQAAIPTIFRTGQALPPWIDVHVLVMRSRQKARDIAGGIQQGLESDEGKAITGAITTALSASNPTVGVVANLAVGLLNLVCRFISQEKDTQLFYSHASIEQADSYCVGVPIVLSDDKHARVELIVQPVT